ncbi:MAG: TIGR04282 family arsenosugar biosynthesis glycosyltransferase [Chitinophagaceae bacterium]
MKQSLLIFAKNLVYGQVKTRIAATLGDAVALTIYGKLLAHTNAVTSNLPVIKTVCYSSFIEAADVWDNAVYSKQLQSGKDLGARMMNAFANSFEEANDAVAVIGTDCFDISSNLIMDAFAALTNHDVVIGPAKDGGYYLLAMKQLHPLLFENIPWSTNDVLKKTIAICTQLQLSHFLLEELSDVDTAHDLTAAQKTMWLKNSV